jgi:hypothetical protein
VLGFRWRTCISRRGSRAGLASPRVEVAVGGMDGGGVGRADVDGGAEGRALMAEQRGCALMAEWQNHGNVDAYTRLLRSSRDSCRPDDAPP